MADQRHAVIIGVDDPGVDATLPALRYATKDAQSVCDILCDSDIGTFDPSDVTLFVGPQAGSSEIKKVLHRIAIASDPSDVLLIYFAGHTMAPPWSLDTDLYLVTPDLQESLRSENPDAGLRMSFLRHDVLKRFAGTAVLILDCCRAGSLLSIPDRDVEMISIGGRGESGYCALMACSSDGVAREDAVLGHGVLTYHLLRGLRGHAVDRQGYVTFQSLSTYVLEQGLDPPPGMSAQQWGSATALTRPGPGVSGTGRQVTSSPPVITSLENPLDRHATDIATLIARLSRSAREPSIIGSSAADRGSDSAVPASARVQYLRNAVGADAVALMEYTADGLTVIDSTSRFDLEDVQHLLHSRTEVPFPVDQNWFGHVSSDEIRSVTCLPVSRTDGKALLLAVVDMPAAWTAMGQPLATVLGTLWRTDFAAHPAEAEVHVLTALRDTFGRLPTSLFQRCLSLYEQVLQSLTIVFQPIVTIGPTAHHVGVHSFEALARLSPDEHRAPVALLQTAHVWGDHFVVARDTIMVRKTLAAYAHAHRDGPWRGDVPKPIAVNVSVRSLLSDFFIEAVHDAVMAAGLDASSVTLEISEQDAIEPRAGENWPDEPHAHFHKRLASVARDVGVAFAVDDFGSGYASLSRMAELPLTQIKVDRAVLHHPQALQELSLVVAVARDAMERGETHAPRTVIVEGVDDESPVTLRQIFGCRIKHIQGHLTREPARQSLRRLPSEVRHEIAARVKGDHDDRATGLTRGDSSRGRHSLRRGA